MAERRVLRRAADDALTTPRAHPDFHRHETDLRADFPPGFGPSRMGSSHASVLSDISTMARRRRATPWYLTRQAFTVLALIVIVALTAWGISAVLRSDDTDGVAPAVSPAAPEAPRPEPVQGSRGDPIEAPVPAPPAPPPPPPAPPPPTAEQLVPRTQYQDPYPRSSRAPDREPEVGVTRTPVTRAPMSVAPVPRQPPVNNSATPGDAKRGGWHW